MVRVFGGVDRGFLEEGVKTYCIQWHQYRFFSRQPLLHNEVAGSEPKYFNYQNGEKLQTPESLIQLSTLVYQASG
jgi:hypothetical protein